MTDRPIIFSGPMVRGLLAGRKTQTRRISSSPLRKCVPGDRLWVRETVRSRAIERGPDGVEYAADRTFQPIDITITAARAWYSLDRYRGGGDEGVGNTAPSIHMPRWASRLTLVVADVRVQKLHDISESDAAAEGIERLKSGRGFYDPTVGHEAVRVGRYFENAKEAFAHLWDSLHGEDAWANNPEVIALTFAVRQVNIDQMRGPADEEKAA